MQAPTLQISQIDNGYIVTVFATPGAATPMPTPPVHQYCADKNAVAEFLIPLLIPGATFTPAPTPAPTPGAHS
jgi:hypothetical protein